jgi:hypothetical protein
LSLRATYSSRMNWSRCAGPRLALAAFHVSWR